MDFKLPNNPKVSFLYKSPAKGMAVLTLTIFFTSLFFTSFVKILLIALSILLLLLTLSNIYIRLQSDWAKIHYPVSIMYAQAMGFITGKHPNLPIEERVLQAFQLVLGTLYPSMTDSNLESVAKEINNDSILTNRQNIYELFKYKGVKEKDLEKITDEIVKRYMLDQPETADKLQISNFYTHIIGARYGEFAVYEYMLAMFNNKVK